MDGWRAVDQQPVTTRPAIAAALGAVADEIVELGAATGVRPTVIACWQDAAYVPSPPGVIERLAEHADVVVACAGRPLLPAGVAHAPLERGEQLTDEWSLTAVTPVAGVQFVAHDVGTTLPAIRVEDGRAFIWDLSADARDLVTRTQRLVRELGARVPPVLVASLAGATRRLRDLAAADLGGTSTVGDGGTSAPGRCSPLRDRIEAMVESVDEQRRRHATTPITGAGLTALADWLTDAGPRVPALGMIVVHCDGCAVTASLRAQAHALGRLGDLIVDVPPDAAMVVMPGLVGESLQERTAVVRDTVADALGRDGVHALGAVVPAVEARLDLVGSLGRALVQLRTAALTG